MRSYHLLLMFSCLLMSFLLVVNQEARADERIWPVKKRIIGKDGKAAKDVSGIACSSITGYPRKCLVVDDELQRAQFVELHDGHVIAGEPVKLIDSKFGGRWLELDGEGVTYGDGAFFVVGSHGHPRDRKRELDTVRDATAISARVAAASQFIRIDFDTYGRERIAKTSKLRSIIANHPSLQRFLDRRLENNGLNIEGLAVIKGGRTLGLEGRR